MISGSSRRLADASNASATLMISIHHLRTIRSSTPSLKKLDAFASVREAQPEQEQILRGLATSVRMLARQHDAIAENSYRKLAEIDPRNGAYHYNLGLFYKTRGRFAEGVRANQTARSLTDEVIERREWNLGICATGARNAATALDVWKRMGQKTESGRFGLPEGRYPPCEVKLVERSKGIAAWCKRPSTQKGLEGVFLALADSLPERLIIDCQGHVKRVGPLRVKSDTRA